jgi:hypothetical protein
MKITFIAACDRRLEVSEPNQLLQADVRNGSKADIPVSRQLAG